MKLQVWVMLAVFIFCEAAVTPMKKVVSTGKPTVAHVKPTVAHVKPTVAHVKPTVAHVKPTEAPKVTPKDELAREVEELQILRDHYKQRDKIKMNFYAKKLEAKELALKNQRLAAAKPSSDVASVSLRNNPPCPPKTSRGRDGKCIRSVDKPLSVVDKQQKRLN